MIQELFGGAAAGLIGSSGDRKISIAEGFLLQTSPSPSPSPSPLSSSSTPPTATTAPENQNLRCPRCDSTNTKFCYYNNYNLTQPRHFCKTCRRYWTKGGALRNVPIGGGCRKNKSVSVSPSATKSTAAKAKNPLSVSEFGKPSYFGNGFDQDLTSSSILWPSPQNSHILALLRANQNHNQNQNPNPNPNPNPSPLSHSFNSSALNARTLGLDVCTSFRRNPQQQQQQLIQHPGATSQETNYNQRMNSFSGNYYFSDQSAVLLASTAGSSASSTILESAPVTQGSDLSFFSPSLSWSDLQTTNAAYP